MIIVLKTGSTEAQVRDLTGWLQAFDVKVSPIEGTEATVLGLVGDTSAIDIETLKLNPVVEKVIKVAESYKKANRKFHPSDSVIQVGGVPVGGKKLAVIAGPCSVEGQEQMSTVTAAVQASGASMLRGGAFKPRSSPYAFQGMHVEGLMLLHEMHERYNIPVVSEITNPFHVDLFEEYVDVIQVGARNMQNFELLKALGKTHRPILLKRGFANSIDEWLMAAEYIMSSGNEDVILCERGIRTFETATRNTLDLSAIPVIKRLSHLPVVVDPSHASGFSYLVPALAKAAVAVGADGLIIEVHPDPSKALCDGAQSLTPAAFDQLMKELRPVAEAVGREL